MDQVESRLSELDKVEEPKSSTKSTWICRNLGTPRKKQKSLNYMHKKVFLVNGIDQFFNRCKLPLLQGKPYP